MNLKHLLTTAGACITMSSFSQQQIPNNNFENWINLGTFDSCAFWNTESYMATRFTNFTNVYKETNPSNVYSGSSAIRLETKPQVVSVQTYTSSGSVFLESPFTSRPTSVSGFCKYLPANTDNAIIYLDLTKRDAITHQQNIVGSAFYSISNQLSSYTGFTVPISYNSAVTPDSISISVLSSPIGSEQAGTKLWVDNLTLNYGVAGIVENGLEKSTVIGPNPTSGIVYIKTEYDIENLVITDALGKVVYTNKPKSIKQLEIDLTDFTKGVYFIRLMNQDGFITKKIIVK